MKLKLLQIIIMLSKHMAYGVFVQVLVMNLLIANDLDAQKHKSVKVVGIAIKAQEESLEKIFVEIEKLTDFNISYDKSELDKKLDKLITVQTSRHTKVSDVLIQISEQAEVSFRQVNQNISVANSDDVPIESIQLDAVEDVELSGKISDENGQGLPGATVIVKGTTIGTTTDVDGNYHIDVPADATLVVSFIGYVSQEIILGGRSVVDVQMVADSQQLDEVVVVGYGVQERANLTNSISQVKSDQFSDVPYSDLANSIAGRMPGVNIKQASGAPGSNPQIVIRGVSTITAGTGPLIVVDGLPLSENIGLNAINPYEIASVEVLKDASAAAIYGSRGANGVILVTTKSGGSGKPEFTFNSYYGVQKVAKRYDLVNAYEQAELMNEARQTRGSEVPNFILPYLDGQQGLTETDWQDHIFVDAPIQNYEVTASGSNEVSDFFVSAGAFSQDGVVIGSKYDRYSVRLNFNTKFSDKLKFGMQLNPSYSERDKVIEGWEDSPISMGINNSLPFFPVYQADGEYALGEQIRAAQVYGGLPEAENNVAISDLTTNTENKLRLLGGTHLEYEIIEGLKAKTYFGGYLASTRSQYFRPSFLGTYRDEAPTIAEGSSETKEVRNFISENTINYTTSINDEQGISVLIGYSYQQEAVETNEVVGRDFPNDNIKTVSAATQITSGTATKEKWALVSYLARVQYDFKGKYLVSAAIRRDGSSRFGSLSRFGTFPSLSGGWRISEESFFPEGELFSDAKVRASWGVAGNNQIGNYGSQALLGSADYNFNAAIAPGLRPSSAPNENLSWEETTTTDIGLDLGLFGDKIYLNVDYYTATTDGMLLDVPVPSHSGYTTSLQNIGKMKNQGYEIALSYSGNVGPLKIQSSAYYATNKNEVLQLGPGQTEIVRSRNITRVGNTIGALYGYKVVGIFETQDQLDNLPNYRDNQLIGDYIFEDLNEDGEITSDDRTIVGDIHPDFSWGFNTMLEYKGFDFAVTIQGVEGVDVFDRNISAVLVNSEVWGNQLREYYDNRWVSEAEPGKYAKPGTNTNNLSRESDLYALDASYIRVRDITLGYSLPQALLEKINLKRARVYLSAKNPFLFTDFLGLNPELNGSNPLDAGVTLGTYPVDKSFIGGISITF